MTLNPVDLLLKNMVGKSPALSRKEFLKATALATTAGALGCGGDSKQLFEPEEKEDVDPLAVIRGTTELQIGMLGQYGFAQYDGSDSEPPGGHFTWKIEKDVDPLGAGEMALGDKKTALAQLVRPGDYTVHLKVIASGKESFATHATKVLPPPAPTEDYPLLAFLRYEDYPPGVGTSSTRVLHVLNPATGAVTRIGGYPTNGFFGGPASWEGGGTRLALESWVAQNKVLKVYDFLRDELTDLASVRDGGPMTPAWNPQKEWIAYSSSERGGPQEPVLIRPDGSEKLFVAGDQPREEVSGYHLSWSPDGERLLIGRTPYNLTGREWPDYRNTIHSGFWSGNLESTRVPTEDQLEAFLAAEGHEIPGAWDMGNLSEDGLAWSPDGEWLAYTMMIFGAGDGTLNMNYLLKSRADAPGEIQVLVRRQNTLGEPWTGMVHPFWSPDGNSIYFTTGNPVRVHRVSAAGGEPTEVTDTDHDWGLAWYG